MIAAPAAIAAERSSSRVIATPDPHSLGEPVPAAAARIAALSRMI
jgi:hypothetical protein